MTGLMKQVLYLTAAIIFFAMADSIAAQSGRVTPTPTPDDTVRIDTEEVKVNILAFDEDDNFFRDVRPEDVVINENNILHQAASLRRLPANVLIVMDTGGELRSVKTLDQTRKTALAVINALRPEDNVAIMQYADKVQLMEDWTNDRERLHAAVRRTKFGRRSVFVNAVRTATEMLSKLPEDNRHMVLITDGTDSMTNSLDRTIAFRNVLSTDINVHVISYAKMEAAVIEPRTKALRNTPPPKAMPDEIAATLPPGVRDNAQSPKIGPTVILDRKHLQTMRQRKADLENADAAMLVLTEDTNGTFTDPITFDEMFAKAALIAKHIDAAYVLTYIPKFPLSQGGGERRIEVTSKRPGLVIHARRKLVIPSER